MYSETSRANLPEPWFGSKPPPRFRLVGSYHQNQPSVGSVASTPSPRTRTGLPARIRERLTANYGQGAHWVCWQTGPVGIPVATLQRNSVRKPLKSNPFTVPSFV